MDEAPRRLGSSLALSAVALLALLVACRPSPASETSADMTIIPLFDGEQDELLNTWGGAWGTGTAKQVGLQTQVVHGGRKALFVELGPVPAGQSRHVQCFATGFGPTRAYYQTRDLLRFRTLEFYAQNATPAAVRGRLEFKDYRDAGEHRAMYRFELPAGRQWSRIEVPLDLASPGWSRQGRPDLHRLLAVDFAFQPQAAIPSGRVYLDDLALVEPGGPVNVHTWPLTAIVGRLARRQWDGLWAARSRRHGLIPSNSYQSTDAGLNATATVLWMLPAATRHHWVRQNDADGYVALLLETINRVLDRAKYLPPRNMDWVSLRPSLLPEESSVDAAFLALGLYQYKSLRSTPAALGRAIHETQNRFNFAAFARPRGWCMAYRYASARDREGFVPFVYDGYTNESNLVSLAAHLSGRYHVPIERYWNATVNRVRGRLTSGEPGPVVHRLKEYRAPFSQALWNLFVDVRRRGVDSYPEPPLAVNPWANFVSYERGVMARLAESGRPWCVQPDAGDDGTLENYRPFSVYEDFGEGDLFMPWSVSFSLLAGADRAEQSLRRLLECRLHGALGLADSAKWAAGAPEPYAVTARRDFWSTGLSTMALLEWLDGDCRLSKSFAALPEVRAALDRVFPGQ